MSILKVNKPRHACTDKKALFGAGCEDQTSVEDNKTVTIDQQSNDELIDARDVMPLEFDKAPSKQVVVPRSAQKANRSRKPSVIYSPQKEVKFNANKVVEVDTENTSQISLVSQAVIDLRSTKIRTSKTRLDLKSLKQ